MQEVGARASFGALLGAAVSVWETAKLAGPEKVKVAGAPILLETLANDLVTGTAVSSLVQSGVPLATAMSLVGWDNVDLPEGASKPIHSGGE